MGLLTDIVNQKVAEKAREQFAAKQAQIGFYQKAMDPSVNPDPQDRAYAEQQLLKLLPPEGKQTYQRGNVLANFFHNVLGHKDPASAPTGNEQAGQSASMAEQADTGAPVTPAKASPTGQLAAPSFAAPTDTAIGDQPLKASGDIDLGYTVPGGLGSAPSTPKPSPAAMLQPPPGVATPPAAQPTTASPSTPAFHSLYSNNTPEKIATQRHLAAVSAGLTPGTAAYQEMIATGSPSTAITTQAKIEAEREAGQKTLQYLVQQGIKIPDWMKAEVLTGKNMGAAAAMRPQWSPAPVNGETAPPGTVDMLGNPVSKGDYRIQVNPYTNEVVNWVPAEIANRFMQGPNQTMVSVNPLHPDTATPVSGVVAPGANRIIQSDLVGGGRGVETAGQALGGGAPTPTPGTIGKGTPTTRVTTPSPSGQTVSTSQTGPRAANPIPAPNLPSTAPAPSAPPKPSVTAPPPQVKPFDPSNRTDSIVSAIGNDAANWKMATNPADKYQITKRMAELGIDPGNITGSMRDRAKNARLILGHLDEVNRIIDQAEKDGELGVVATRWNDFLTNKLGTDPTKDQTFAKLSSELGFLSTAVAMAHGGLRGGSSPGMVEHWEKALEAKDAGTLRAKLGEAKKWMQGYATLDHGMQDVSPIHLKNGSVLTPHDKATENAFRKDHPELIAQ
jgi:hypothetical protein